MGEAAALELKDQLAKERKEVEALHRGGALGGQVSSAFVDLFDRIIARAYREAVENVASGERSRVLRELALVAVGGYGRGDMAPFSDVDLLFLVAPRAHPIVEQVTNGLVRRLWDIGMKLSQSVRTPGNCISFARQDFALRTSLAEMRFLTGSEGLTSDLQRRVHRLMANTWINRFIATALNDRVQEHKEYSVASASLLEPNVKKSPGGLREVHLLRWVALPRYGIRDTEMLRIGGVLTAEDAGFLAETTDLLLRIRHELHFRAGAAQDVLTRDEQVRVAKWLEYEDEGPLLGVERFMQQYHRRTSGLHDLVMRFLDGARKRSPALRFINRMLTHRVGDHILVSRDGIALDPDAPDGALARAEVLLQLFDMARQHGVKVAHESLERVRKAVPGCEVTPPARSRFLRIMENPEELGGLVRDLHRVGLLGRFIPAFEHARCLMQFNQYHKYTVDEHSIRALEAAAWRNRDPGPIGKAYREIKRKDVLHLAALLHDIGKGREEDHSEVGKRLAVELSDLLGLDEKERDRLVFLVHKHLLMAHTAFRRDVSDMKTIVQFVRQVGTLETLRMLYVLTAADTEAVAPGSFTSWKESLLTELYDRSCDELAGDTPVADEREKGETVRHKVREKLRGQFPDEKLEKQLGAMPLSYLQRVEPEIVAAHLRGEQAIETAGVHVDSEYVGEIGLTQYTVFAREGLTPGIFSKISGVLAAERFQIVDARILTWGDGLIVDTFRGVDGDFKAEPPLHRRIEVAQQIERVLLGKKSVEELFAARRPSTGGEQASASGEPTRVEIDNASSDHYTVVEIFTDDRPGLLYVIARTLLELGLSVASAKISTRLDQVVDVFYVADKAGKITGTARLAEIRRRLLDMLASTGVAP